MNTNDNQAAYNIIVSLLADILLEEMQKPNSWSDEDDQSLKQS
ncbi:hypothetical protein [Paenibacillus polymyxa]|nr:hypothetical protein [Paenibacillus polymyxa]